VLYIAAESLRRAYADRHNPEFRMSSSQSKCAVHER
jgi:hypothetical protein